MAAKGKRTKGKINNYTKGVTPITPVNPPLWGPTWGGNRANVPVPPPNYALFDLSSVQKPVWMQPGYGPIASNTFPAFQPSASTTTTTPTTQTTTKTVDNTNPEMRYFNPYLNEQYAEKLTTGNPPTGGTYADWQEWNRQMSETDPNHSYYNPYNTPYAWQWNPNVPGTLIAGADPRSQEGVPWQDALNIPWSSSYAPEYYKNQRAKQYTWVGGRTGGASSKGTGRMPSRYYIPQQEFYKTPGGKTYVSRDGWEDAFGKDENPPGNNRNVSIPAWVGPLVSWRT